MRICVRAAIDFLVNFALIIDTFALQETLIEKTLFDLGKIVSSPSSSKRSREVTQGLVYLASGASL